MYYLYNRRVALYAEQGKKEERSVSHCFQYSEARSNLKKVYDDVVRGNVALIKRRGSRPVAVWDVAEAAELLAELFPMDPQVSFGDGHVAMWLPNLPVHAEGRDFDEAAESLVDALLDYVQLWEEELRHAPNHALNRRYVRQVQLCGGDREQVHRLLFNA